MTQLLGEEQPVPDDENAKKPAILKHQSIILTDEELKELGMKDLSENTINCEIAEEEEEYAVDGECNEKPMHDDEVENQLTEKEIDENCSNELEANHDIEGSTQLTDDGNKENEIENESNNEEVEGSKIEDDQNTDESKTEKESNENSHDPEVNVETVEIEIVTEETTPKDTEKPNEIKQKPLTRPISGHKFKIPPMWAPANPRANAAFVYIFFRHVSSFKSYMKD